MLNPWKGRSLWSPVTYIGVKRVWNGGDKPIMLSAHRRLWVRLYITLGPDKPIIAACGVTAEVSNAHLSTHYHHDDRVSLWRIISPPLCPLLALLQACRSMSRPRHHLHDDSISNSSSLLICFLKHYKSRRKCHLHFWLLMWGENVLHNVIGINSKKCLIFFLQTWFQSSGYSQCTKINRIGHTFWLLWAKKGC